MTRLRTGLHLSRQAFLSTCSILLFLVAASTTPTMHAQEIAADQRQTPETANSAETTVAATQANTEATVTESSTAESESAPSQTTGDSQDQQAAPRQNPNPAATYQPVTWKNLPRRVLGDQKLVWLFPLHVAQGQHVLPTVAIVGVTGGLIAADPTIERHLHNHVAAFHEYDKIFSGTNTGVVTALIPTTFYLYGLVHKSSYAEQTGLLAGEAYLDSAIPEVAMKLVSRRLRPIAIPPGSDYTDTFFAAHVSLFGKGSSFPSGHAAGIFSIATVVSERYRQHRWVPWVMYGLATAISFSRVPTFAHFPSEVFLGAALGYTITRFDVLRDRTH